MTIGEEVTTLLLKQDLSADPLSYEGFQELKRLESIAEVKRYLHPRYPRIQAAESVEDVVFHICNPWNAKMPLLSGVFNVVGWTIVYLQFFYNAPFMKALACVPPFIVVILLSTWLTKRICLRRIKEKERRWREAMTARASIDSTPA